MIGLLLLLVASGAAEAAEAVALSGRSTDLVAAPASCGAALPASARQDCGERRCMYLIVCLLRCSVWTLQQPCSLITGRTHKR